MHIDNCPDAQREATVKACQREDTLYSWKNALMAEDDGKVVGCVIFYDGTEYEERRRNTYKLLKDFMIGDILTQDAETQAGEYYIDSLAVVEEERHKGIGTLLLKSAIDHAKQTEIPAITLACDPENNSAKALYLSLGFKEANTIHIFNYDYTRMTMQLNNEKSRKELARELFLKGYNCSQSVFCAFADDYGIPFETALKLSSSFGGGIGRMRETCGAFCGAAMVLGLETGQTDASDAMQKQNNYHTIQAAAERFREKNGSIKCSELLQLRKDATITDKPDERTAEYYRQRPCLMMVDSAVDIVEDFLRGKNKGK
ncbi:MAG: C-GCAxxG-C-C family (seleno)protein [Prevotellaceae bacterium]|nr:C-GCAxxG-C-C family (seleno)protein [Prevotellaceae bacterium]